MIESTSETHGEGSLATRARRIQRFVRGRAKAGSSAQFREALSRRVSGHEHRRPPKERLALLGWALLLLLGTPTLLAVLVFAIERWQGVDRVLRGVWLADRALVGLSADEVRETVASLERRWRERELVVRVKDRLFTVTAEQLGLKVAVDKAVASSLGAGRAGALSAQWWWWVSRWWEPVHLPVAGHIDSERVVELLGGWERAAIQQLPDAGGIAWRDGEIVQRVPRGGWVIEETRAKQDLQRAALAPRSRAVTLGLRELRPTLAEGALVRAARLAALWVSESVLLTRSDPEMSLTLDKRQLGEALESRLVDGPSGSELELYFDPAAIKPYCSGPEHHLLPRDASFEVDGKDHVRVVPGHEALRVDPEQVAAALRSVLEKGERGGELPVVKGAQPALTTEAAEALGIGARVASFSTRHACCHPRVKNIHRIADLLDGVIVLPGAKFSVNQHVGRRTTANGFVSAPSIEDGEMVETVGGGISQFATTMFNAVLHGGYDIVERQPHSYWFSRYPMGHEATLSWPKPDLVFRNDTRSGLLIKTEYTDRLITVKLYGDSEGRQVRTKVSLRQDIVQPPVELIANDEIAVAREKVVDGGKIGWSVITERRVLFSDGTEKKESRKVTYSPEVRRVEIHSCRIPRGEEGYTGEPCPVPDEEEQEPEFDEDPRTGLDPLGTLSGLP